MKRFLEYSYLAKLKYKTNVDDALIDARIHGR